MAVSRKIRGHVSRWEVKEDFSDVQDVLEEDVGACKRDKEECVVVDRHGVRWTPDSVE